MSSGTRVEFEPVLKTPEQRLIEQMGEGNGPQIESPAGGVGSDGKGPTDDVIVERVIAALKTIYDPEIPVNIYDLGLIYRVESKDRVVEVDMTLTAPGCPVAQTFPGMVEGTVKLVPGVDDAVVELVWDPPWRQELISEEARLELGLL